MKRNYIETFRLCEDFLSQNVISAKGCALDPTQIGIRPIARAAHVTEQTVFRWIRGDQKPDAAALQLLRLNTLGLVVPEKDWPNFRFRAGHLWFDDTYSATVIDMRRFFLNW